MEPPEPRFARTRDGLAIAYQVVGGGSVDLLLLTDLACVDIMWEDSVFAASLRRLAGLGRLICFDPRGLGVSDSVPLGALPTIETRCEDFTAVLDAVGSEQTTLIGMGLAAGPLAMFYAATYPHRVERLVLVNTCARYLKAEDYPLGADPEHVQRMIDAAWPHWGHGVFSLVAPSRAGAEEFRRWHGRYERMSMSPGTWRTEIDWVIALDVRDLLPNIRVPSLILHCEGNALGPEIAGYIADRVPDARIVILSGADLTLYGGSADEMVDRIEEFLTGASPVRDLDRALTTVLFTDIVGSTDQAAKLGDRAWSKLLGQHDALVEREIERHRGKKVNPTGDGVLATFDGPARAVRCAEAICRAAPALGVEVRAGLHTGEVELRGEDIGGIAVHIGQRISALAGPGEILVSRTVTDLVVGSGIEFDEWGEYELKGVPNRWQVFAVRA